MIRLRGFTKAGERSVTHDGCVKFLPIFLTDFLNIATSQGGVKVGMDDEEIADILQCNAKDEMLEGEQMFVFRRPDGLMYAVGITEVLEPDESIT